MSVSNPDEMEEERRLAYVAMTRAERSLYLIHAEERMFFGKTQRNPKSKFICEIDKEYSDEEEPKKSTPPKQPIQPMQQTRKRKYQLSAELTRDVSDIAEVGKTKSYERFESGERVLHMTFGEGTILTVTEMGADIMYEIIFDKVGTKKLMATYAKLKRPNN